MKRDGTRAETRFGLSAKRTSPFKLAGASVQSTTGSRGVRISGSNGGNAGYTMFWGRVQDYWLPTQFACFPFTSPTVCHRVPSGFNWALQLASLFCTVDVLKLSTTESDAKNPDGTLLTPSYRANRFLSKILIRAKARPTRCKNRPSQYYLELLLSDHLQRGVLVISTCRFPFPVPVIDSGSIRKH